MFIVVVIFYVRDMYTVVYSVYFGLRWLKNCESTLIIWWHFVQDGDTLFLMTWDISEPSWWFEFQLMFQSAKVADVCYQEAEHARSFYNDWSAMMTGIFFKNRSLLVVLQWGKNVLKIFSNCGYCKLQRLTGSIDRLINNR